MKVIYFYLFFIQILVFCFTGTLNSQTRQTAKVAVIQASKSPGQDLFMVDYDPVRGRSDKEAHFNKLLGLFEQAGRMGADIVCGPENMYGGGTLHIDVVDPETGEQLCLSLAVPVPGPLTDRVADIARRNKMYIIAPICERDQDKVFNTSVIFDRQGNILGKYRKTVLPVMETWGYSTGDEYPVFETDFATIAIATCWEIRFPEITSIYALKGADIIFNPTMGRENSGPGLATAPRYLTRAMDNYVYIVPVILGSNGSGIIDFNGKVVAEAPGVTDTVIMAEIDFSIEPIVDSEWWTTINGTDNQKAIRFLSRRPETYKLLTEPNPPVLDRYRDIHLTTGNRQRQLEALRDVDYGPKKLKQHITFAPGAETELWRNEISLIPYPQKVEIAGENFVFEKQIDILIDKGAVPADVFTADNLRQRLNKQWNIECRKTEVASGKCIILTRQEIPDDLGEQGYKLIVEKDRITILGGGEAGLFYGTRTLLQIIQKDQHGPYVKGMKITDWPGIIERAVHYDTKHHQDKSEYVRSFIRDLADYKINMLIWEWEDKFAYESHPEIGAPGAFTKKEMQEFTRYARKYHIQIVPLVQGLGHVSYILKWPQHSHLREIEGSNWQFCPLKDGTYDLLFDLWDEAIEATPGSEYVHIGSDETYELGLGMECGCKAKTDEIGKHGLMQIFISRCYNHFNKTGRKVMSWGGYYRSEEEIQPPEGLITFSSGRRDRSEDKKIIEMGYPLFFYDPGSPGPTGLEKANKAVSSATLSGIYTGMVATSWDDLGRHNQRWMMRFVNAAEYSWSGGTPGYDEFVEKYFKNYYGPEVRSGAELWKLYNEGEEHYRNTFERKVWHYGEIGKTHLPDMPRGDAIEYDPYWNREYKEIVDLSREELVRMQRALEICNINIATGVKHSYDFEVFASRIKLNIHNCRTYLALSELEKAITEAHRQHFISHKEACGSLKNGVRIIEDNLAERDSVFRDLVATWEKTRLPKGMNTPEKKFFFQQDRARHFAFRRPDMTYLIYDEQLLGIEQYLEDLRKYMAWYKKRYLSL